MSGKDFFSVTVLYTGTGTQQSNCYHADRWPDT